MFPRHRWINSHKYEPVTLCSCVLAAAAPPAGSVLCGVCRAAGVSGSGRPEGGTDVSGVEVWGNADGARRPTLLHQRTDIRSDRPGAARQTRQDQEEVRSEVTADLPSKPGIEAAVGHLSLVVGTFLMFDPKFFFFVFEKETNSPAERRQLV